MDCVTRELDTASSRFDLEFDDRGTASSTSGCGVSGYSVLWISTLGARVVLISVPPVPPATPLDAVHAARIWPIMPPSAVAHARCTEYGVR